MSGRSKELNALTADEVRHALDYDAASGLFTWKNPTSPRLHVGDSAGHFAADGYVRIRVGYTKYLAHRLAWLYVHGSWPTGMLDHANRDPGDNRIANLREATAGENSANRSSVARALPRGVTRSGSKFVAGIQFQRKVRYLGTFKTAEEAGAAYAERAAEYFGPFAVVA